MIYVVSHISLSFFYILENIVYSLYYNLKNFYEIFKGTVKIK